MTTLEEPMTIAPPRRRTLPAALPTLIVLLVLALGSSGFALTSYLRGADERGEPAAAAAARRAGASSLETILSYDQSSLDAITTKARSLVTPSFAQGYLKLVEKQLAPQVAGRAITVATSVVASGLVSVSTDQVEVLYFLNQEVTSGGTEGSSGSRVLVRLDRVEGHWLIDEITTV